MIFIKRLAALAAGIFIMSVATLPVFAADEGATSKSAAFTPAQSQAVEKLIHDYLLSHPDVLIEAMSNAEASMKARTEADAKKSLQASSAQLYDDSQSPILGNPKGNTTLVEFFDYRCPYCKVVAPSVLALIEKNPQLRIIMKEYPILSPESELAARVALVAAAHGKYLAFHGAMFAFKGTFNNDAVLQVAQSVGLDPATLKTETQAPAIAAEIQRNQLLARMIGIDGTPSFIAGNTIVPGAIDAAGLQALITKAAGNTPAKS